MDFVVVGLGLGALGVLLGVALLGWLAGQTERRAAAAPTPAAAAYERAAAAEYRSTGQAFLYAGAAVILATVGGLAGALDDQIGAVLVATTATVGALGILLWGFLHRSRHPMPPRPRRQLTTDPAPEATLAAPATQAAPASRPPDAAILAAPADTAPATAEPATAGTAASAAPSDTDAATQPTPEFEHAAGSHPEPAVEPQDAEEAAEPDVVKHQAKDEGTPVDADLAHGQEAPARDAERPPVRTMANSRP